MSTKTKAFGINFLVVVGDAIISTA